MFHNIALSDFFGFGFNCVIDPPVFVCCSAAFSCSALFSGPTSASSSCRVLPASPCTCASPSCGALPLSVSASSSSGLSLFYHGGESISPYVTKVTRFLDTSVSPCPGRMGATPLRMAERAETRGRPHTAHVRLQAPEGTADCRGGLPTPSSGHTNALIHTT